MLVSAKSMRIEDFIISFCQGWRYYLVFTFTTTVTMFPHFHQTEYLVISERMEVNNSNQNGMTVKVRNSKFNRTHVGINMTINLKQDFGYSLEATIQTMKFASNEYRLFPIMFTGNVCDILENNDFGIYNIYDCGNLTKCPVKKGEYIVCNWGPDYTKYPPHWPIGRYRMDVKFRFKNDDLVGMNWYMEVKSTKFLNYK